MQLAYFTKHWPGASVQELARTAVLVGADGLDLAVRPGHAVNPENVAEALPEAVRTCSGEGVTIGMVTMETKPTDPADPAVEKLFAACGEAGIRFVKPGYFQHRPGQDYWAEVERLRGVLAELGEMAARHGGVVCYHNHSGGFYGSNAAGLMHLLRGQDPGALGAYVDVGHLALNGETLPLAVDMVRDCLRLVGVKSPAWDRVDEDGQTLWKARFVPLEEGVVDCRLLLGELKRIGFDGVLTFHAEYEMPPDELLQALRGEIAYCRRLLEEV